MREQDNIIKKILNVISAAGLDPTTRLLAGSAATGCISDHRRIPLEMIDNALMDSVLDPGQEDAEEHFRWIYNLNMSQVKGSYIYRPEPIGWAPPPIFSPGGSDSMMFYIHEYLFFYDGQGRVVKYITRDGVFIIRYAPDGKVIPDPGLEAIKRPVRVSGLIYTKPFGPAFTVGFRF